MNLTPIKLIKNRNVRTTLLNVKEGETAEIDTSDYIERRMTTNAAARYLMAIEDASEVAKQLLQERGIFEQIGRDIKKEAGYDFKFQCKRTSNMNKPTNNRSGVTYVHMAHTYPDNSGHYALAKVSHQNKTIDLFDSMGAGRSEFKNELKTVYGRDYKIRKRNTPFQPTGGFVTTDVNNYKKLLKDTKISIRNPRVLEKSFEISQYDELSQHHFCYIEAFIAMMHDTLGTPLGPKDPRDRLVFIKRIVWGLIHKYVPPSKRKTLKWKYFVTNFPYYIKVTNTQGNRFKLNHIVQIPKLVNGLDIERAKKSLMKLDLTTNIKPSWTLTQIVNWAGSKI
jgi:hypothetical protein